jgi:hypothetical protein
MSNSASKFSKMRERLQEVGKKEAPPPGGKSGKPPVYEVDGDLPKVPANIGDTVMLCYGDPLLIDSGTVYMPAMVTNGMAQGRVNVQAFFDVFLRGSDSQGRPVQMPPVGGFGNVPYSRTRKALTWCWRDDLIESALAEQAQAEQVAQAEAPAADETP